MYIRPTLEALRALGGSATNDELYEHVTKAMQLTVEQLELLHNPEKSTQTEVAYRMAWARTYLRKVGLIENSKRRVWSLTRRGQEAQAIDAQTIVQKVQTMYAVERHHRDILP